MREDRKFDISWVTPPPRERDGDSGSGGGTPPSTDKVSRGGEGLEPSRLDDRLRQALVEWPESHVVDLAAKLGVDFDEALRGVLRLAAHREVIIKRRDPVANDHLVALSDLPRRTFPEA